MLNAIKKMVSSPVRDFLFSCHHRSILPIANLINLCEKELEIPKNTVLYGTGIDITDLDKPCGSVSLLQVRRIRENLEAFIPYSEIGLIWGKACKTKDLWIFGQFINSSSTVKEAINSCLSLHRWIEYFPFGIKLKFDVDTASIYIPLTIYDCKKGLTVAENALLSKWYYLLREVGPKDMEISCSMTTDRQTVSNLYSEFNNISIKFNCNSFKIEFPSKYLYFKNPMRNDFLKESSRSYCSFYFEKQSEVTTSRLTDKMMATLYEQYINDLISKGKIRSKGIDWACNDLDISPVTLHRHLKKEDSETFKDITFQSRMEFAKAFLLTSKLTIAEIAHRIGYSNDSNFIRAFKKHSGMYPGKYRKSNGVVKNNLEEEIHSALADN